MVDVVITPANVQPTGSTVTRKGIAAVNITAGQSVYIDATGEIDLCQHDQTAVEAAVRGIALNTADAGQPVEYAVSGEIDLGAVLAAGQVYIVGAGAGAIAPETDAGAGDFVSVVGVGVSANNIKLGLLLSGVAHA